MCILIWLRLDCGRISNKSRIRRSRLLVGGGHSVLKINGAVLIRERHLFRFRRLLEKIRYIKINFSQYFMQYQLG